MKFDDFVKRLISSLRFPAAGGTRLDLDLFSKSSGRITFYRFISLRMFLKGCWILGLLVLLSPPVSAHRVNVFAWVEGDTVFVECKYPDGIKVHEGVIRVLDSGGTELLTGKTNEKGEFSFKAPKPDDLTIVLEAGMGHRADWPLSKQDLAAAGAGPGPAAPPLPAGKTQTPPTVAEGSAPVAASPQPAGIEQAIEKALDKKLAPVLRMLAEMHEQKVRLTDVLGGIGYIAGLVGVAAYFKRKPR